MSSFLRPLLLVPLLLAACGGRYDVGEQAQAGSSGAGEGQGGAATNGGNGGTPTTGGGGGSESGGTGARGGTGATGTGATGGFGATGGTGAGAMGGFGATGTGATGGVGATGGSGTTGGSGGAGGAVPTWCGVGPFEADYRTLAPPDVVWNRLTKFFLDEGLEPFGALPEVTTPEWAAETARVWLADARATGAVPRGLASLMREFLDQTEDTGLELGERWGFVLSSEGATLSSLLTDERLPFGVFADVAVLWPEISTRGTWVNRNLLCVEVGLHPPDIIPLEPSPNQTRREALTAEVSSPACVGCHSIIDPPGFALEILAPGTGELRTTDNGLPIDASGEFLTQAGTSFTFSDIRDLSLALSSSCEVARCFVTQLFYRASVNAQVPEPDQADVDGVVHRFATEGQFSIEDALVGMVQSPAFLR